MNSAIVQGLYAEVQQMHKEVHAMITGEMPHLPQTVKLDDAADTSYLLRQCIELLEDIKPQLETFKKTYDEVAIVKSMSAMTGTIPTGKVARAHLKLSKAARIPSFTKDPVGYQNLCKILGVQFDENTRLHYPTLKKMISNIMDKHGVLPPELQPFCPYEETIIVTTALTSAQAADSLPDYLKK